MSPDKPDVATRSAARPSPRLHRGADTDTDARMSGPRLPELRLLESPPRGDSPSEPDETMAEIDAILTAVCDDIALGWRGRSPEPADVLADDLPDTLLSWLLPAGGKRLRPLMCHWGWVAAHGDVDGPGRAEMVQAGAALELLHFFALVHDDVMDRGESRRGRPTAHVEAARSHAEADALGDPVLFGDSVAILLGDLALSEASVLMAGAPAPMQHLWREMLRELVHGQLLDVTAAAARRRDLDHARRVARLKSGAYTIQRPLQLGALAAGADEPVLAALTAYGEHLGEAFAMRDDMLGVWGDPAATGKPVGDDLLASKATVLLAEARRLLPPDASERYLGAHAQITPDDVPVLQALMVEAGVREEVERRIDRDLSRALEQLDDAGLHATGVANLTALAHAVAWRAS